MPVAAVIVLEMIGCFSDDAGSQRFPVPLFRLYYPSRGNFIGIVGDLGAPQRTLVRRLKRNMRGSTELPVRSVSVPRIVPGVNFSDHRSYWDLDYPAVMVTDTAFYRNPRYHCANDTADTLDYRRMAQTVVALYEAVVALAE